MQGSSAVIGAIRWLIVLSVVSILASLMGFLLAAVFDDVPNAWLTPQAETGRPPRFAALLALLPIVVVAGWVVLVKLWRWAKRDGSFVSVKRQIDRRALVTFVVLMSLLGFASSVAYFYSERSDALFPEDCARRCAPKQGVIERQGLSAGPAWRPTKHNLVCTCR